MSDQNSLSQRIGGLSLPLQDVDETTLASLDPARDILLDLFEAAINDELSPRWADATSSGVLPFTSAVQTKFPHELSQELLGQTKIKFPVLAVYRAPEDQEVTEHTIWNSRVTTKWGVDLILGPLSVGSKRKLGDVLTAAGKIILATVERGGHKAYSQAAAGFPTQVLLEQAYCNFIQVEVKSFNAGKASFSDDGPTYHALSVQLETQELVEPTTAEGGQYAGATYNTSTGNEEGFVPDFVVADTSV